jgi:hypothetical protein
MPLSDLARARLRYVDLLKRSVLGLPYVENELRIRYLRRCLDGKDTFDVRTLRDVWKHAPDDALKVVSSIEAGCPTDWNLEELGFEHTMIGRKRLENIDDCVRRVLADQIPGDLMECGVWRGGASVFMRGLLEAYEAKDRLVWVADSFRGLPPPTDAHDVATNADLTEEKCPTLAVDLETVKRTFDAYGLLDDRVRFLPGWFKDTLPSAPVGALAVLRLDGDLYESTRDALQALYDKVSPGGFLIVDDLYLTMCKKAVDDFRAERGIEEPIVQIDWTGGYWRKPRT